MSRALPLGRMPIWLKAYLTAGFVYLAMGAALDLRGGTGLAPVRVFSATALPLGLWWLCLSPVLHGHPHRVQFVLKWHAVAFLPWAVGAASLAGWSVATLGPALLWTMVQANLLVIVSCAVAMWLLLAPVAAFWSREYRTRRCESVESAARQE